MAPAQQSVYDLFGRPTASDVELPLPPAERCSPPGAPVWRFRLSPDQEAPRPVGEQLEAVTCDCPIHDGRIVRSVYREGPDAWMWFQDAGTFTIGGGSGVVHVYPEGASDNPLLPLILLGSAATFLLNRQGTLTLHGSAVVLDGKAVAFLGPSGQGKSTMAAAFVRRGAALVTDDVLPVSASSGELLVGPGLPLMKVWPESLTHTLAVSADLPRIPRLEKRIFAMSGHYPVATSSTKLRAVYVLQRFNPDTAFPVTSTRRLSGASGLATILAHISEAAFLSSSEQTALLPMLSRLVNDVPVKELRYPSGFAYQDAVYQQVLDDLNLGGDD